MIGGEEGESQQFSIDLIEAAQISFHPTCCTIDAHPREALLSETGIVQ